MKKWVPVLCGLWLLAANQSGIAGHVIRPRPVSGILREYYTEDGTIFVGLTGADGNGLPPGVTSGFTADGSPIDRWPMYKDVTNSTGKPKTASFGIPDTVYKPNDKAMANPIAVTDVDQEVVYDSEFSPRWKFVAAGGLGLGSDLRIEAVFQDPTTGQFQLDNIFGALASKVGAGVEVLIPDLFSPTNNVLYGLVDLNTYLNNIPTFSLGDSFSITNGTTSALPGMDFSTTPFIFNPTGAFSGSSFGNGFFGTPYTGEAFALAAHGATATPEPSTLALFCIGLLGLFAYGRRCRKKAISILAGS